MRYTGIQLSTFVILVGVFTRNVSCSRHASRELVEDKIDNKKKTPYEFGYEIQDQDGNKQHRHESSDEDGVRRGSYGYVDANGVYRKVEYIADKNGFRVKEMKSNEPGFDSKEKPADVVKLKHIDNSDSNLLESNTRARKKVTTLKDSKERQVNNYKVLATMKHRPIVKVSIDTSITSSDPGGVREDKIETYRPITSFIESPKFKSGGPKEYDTIIRPQSSSDVGSSSYTVPIYQDVKGGRKTVQHVQVQYPTKTTNPPVKLVDYSKKGKPVEVSGGYLNEPIDGYTLLKAIETGKNSYPNTYPTKSSSGEDMSKYQHVFEPVRINSRPPLTSSEYQHPIEPQYHEVHRYPTTPRPYTPYTPTTSYPTTSYPTTQSQYPSNSYTPTTNYPTTNYPTTNYPTTPRQNYQPVTQYSTTNQYPSTSPYLPPPPYMNTYNSGPSPPTSRPYGSPAPYTPTPYSSTSYTPSTSSYNSPTPYDSVSVHPYPDNYSPSTIRKQMVPSVFYAEESNYPPLIEPSSHDTSSYYSPHRTGQPPTETSREEPPEPPSLPSLPFSSPYNPYSSSGSSPRRGSWYDSIRSSRPSTLTTPSDTIPSVILGIQVALQSSHNKDGDSSSASSWNASSSLPSYDSNEYNPSHYPSHHQIMLLRRGLGKLIPLLHKKDLSNSLSKGSSGLSSSASDQRNQIFGANNVYSSSSNGDLEPSASKKFFSSGKGIENKLLPVYRD